jgi:hypothetical protein
VLVEVGDDSLTVPLAQRRDPLRAGGRGRWLIDAMSAQQGVRTCHQGRVVWALLPANTRDAKAAQPDRV